MKKTKISFYTLGCRTNQAETAVLTNFLESQGYIIADPGQASEIAIINTCTVTKNSDTDTRRLVNKIIRRNPGIKIALIGCQAQVQKEKLSHLPNVRWVVGNQTKFDLANILATTQENMLQTPPILRQDFTLPASGADRYHTRANLKIQDGCDAFCSFCEVPFARGRARSRVFEDIVKDAVSLANAGHQEIVLTGINIGKYKYQGKTILDIIKALEDIEKLVRIRISSIEPTDLLHKLINHMTKPTKLCRHLHIPIQSGSNRILQLMKRSYTAEQLSAFIETTYSKVPDICLGTDVIVGFPGESTTDFQATMRYLKNSPIHYIHVFSYSKRSLAASKNFSGVIDPKIIKERSQTLRNLSLKKRSEFYQTMIGRTFPVLFEQKKGNFWTGLTDNFIHVKVASCALLSNKIHKVALNKISDQFVIGTTT